MVDNKRYVGMLLKELADALERKSNQFATQEDGLTSSQVRVLLMLNRTDGHTLSFSKLKERLNIAQPTVWGLVKRLEAKGVVTTHDNPNDARARLVTMTDVGQKAFETARKHMQQLESSLTNGFDEQELEQLKNHLERLIDNCNAS